MITLGRTKIFKNVLFETRQKEWEKKNLKPSHDHYFESPDPFFTHSLSIPCIKKKFQKRKKKTQNSKFYQYLIKIKQNISAENLIAHCHAIDIFLFHSISL